MAGHRDTDGGMQVQAPASDFSRKRSPFIERLREQRQEGSPIQLKVRRSNALLDSFRSLFYKTGLEVRDAQISVRFYQEPEDVDVHTWLAVTFEQLFDPDFALFVVSSSLARGKKVIHPSSLSGINQEHLSFFRLAGRMVALALREEQLLPIRLSKTMIHLILSATDGRPPQLDNMLEDMQTLDPERYASLDQILKDEFSSDMDQTFSFTKDSFGAIEVIDLMDNGRNVAVTEANKNDFFRLTAEHVLIKSVREQLDSFSAGLSDVVPLEMLSVFSTTELDWLFSGSS